MANANTNSMAAVLSLIVRVIFWLSIIFGTFFFVIIGLGLLGSLNGGALNLPPVQALAQGVPPGRLSCGSGRYRGCCDRDCLCMQPAAPDLVDIGRGRSVCA